MQPSSDGIPQVVWNELGPRDHFCQFYDQDETLLDTVEGFLGPGMECGDSAIIIATTPHLVALEQRFRDRGIDIDQAMACDQYMALDAAETLAKFMNKGWPDQGTFLEVVHEIIARASAGNRRVRAFGEMVSLLWESGNKTATIRLEKLWNDLGRAEKFSLFCAYPATAFSAVGCQGSLNDIHAAHSRVISATGEFESLVARKRIAQQS